MGVRFLCNFKPEALTKRPQRFTDVRIMIVPFGGKNINKQIPIIYYIAEKQCKQYKRFFVIKFLFQTNNKRRKGRGQINDIISHTTGKYARKAMYTNKRYRSVLLVEVSHVSYVEVSRNVFFRKLEILFVTCYSFVVFV